MTRDEKHTQFLQVLNDCRGTILGLCIAYSGKDIYLRQDLYQEVVYNLWSGYSRFDHKCSPSTWVHRVALNTIFAHKRRHLPRHYDSLSDALLSAEIPNVDDSPLTERLYELISCLKPDDKALILLYLDGMKQAEIAGIFGQAESTINHRIVEIKKKLKYLNENERY